MVKKVYGNHIMTCKWIEGGGALVNRTMEIYKLKKTYKCLIWDSGKSGWREEPNKPIKEFKEANLMKVLYDYHTLDSFDAVINPEHDYGTIKGDAEAVLESMKKA